MGVNGTGQIFKGFTFDGENSKNYGVHITGQAVYNAPVRDVEMITIPGRNGAFAFDHGRFDNIEVTYPAGMFGATQTDFADGISALRNFLCSRKGYCRLTDDYNSNEYRMAVYKSGLEASPVQYGQAGEFDITFNCKPQRFLTSGETAVTKANNSTITNPTLFPSSPLLQVTGYGTLNLGSETITINHVAIGDVVIKSAETFQNSNSKTVTLDTTYANSGDVFRLSASCTKGFLGSASTDKITSVTPTLTGNGNVTTTVTGYAFSATISTGDITFSYGTSRTETNTVALSVVTENNGTKTGSITFSVAYNGASTITLSTTVTAPTSYPQKSSRLEISQVILNSTQQASSTYIDLETGEAYALNNGEMTSLNNIVVLPAELPTLQPGSTTITKDNTITQLKITPRWWKI